VLLRTARAGPRLSAAAAAAQVAAEGLLQGDLAGALARALGAAGAAEAGLAAPGRAQLRMPDVSVDASVNFFPNL
jgi:hypothetical protein